MALIKPYMAVKCRNSEEIAIFKEVAQAEGHSVSGLSDTGQVVFVTNYASHFQFPSDIGQTTDMNYVDQNPKNTKIFVEAAELFRNKLISRRLK